MAEEPFTLPDLEIPEAELFQEREWKVRRLGAFVLGGVLIAAALGVFGGGPLARASGDAGGLHVEFDRFARHGRSSALRVRLDRAAGDAVTIAVEGGYFTGATIETIFPRPTVTTDSGDVQRFTFAAVAGEPVVVRFGFLPASAGSHGGAVRVGDAAVKLSTFVYP